MRNCGASEEWPEEPDQADDHRFLPFRAENGRIEFGPGEEGQHYCACARQKGDPIRCRSQPSVNHESADDKLGDRADDGNGASRDWPVSVLICRIERRSAAKIRM
jgi:hypothetical protein